jgi:ankyrin repeat protein
MDKIGQDLITPLHLAVERNNGNVALIFLREGASIDARDLLVKRKLISDT